LNYKRAKAIIQTENHSWGIIMKKLVTLIVLAAIIAIISQSAEARWGNGQGNVFGLGAYGNYDQNTAVDTEARETFLNMTLEL